VVCLDVWLILTLEIVNLICRFGNITTMEWWNYLYLNEGPSCVIEIDIFIWHFLQGLLPWFVVSPAVSECFLKLRCTDGWSHYLRYIVSPIYSSGAFWLFANFRQECILHRAVRFQSYWFHSERSLNSKSTPSSLRLISKRPSTWMQSSRLTPSRLNAQTQIGSAKWVPVI
jgi:hypothetical protein